MAAAARLPVDWHELKVPAHFFRLIGESVSHRQVPLPHVDGCRRGSKTELPIVRRISPQLTWAPWLPVDLPPAPVPRNHAAKVTGDTVPR